MRNVALTRKHARVLEAAAAAERADEPPSVVTIATRVPLRPDLVEVIASELATRGLLACWGEFAVDVDFDLQRPGPEFRITRDGQRALSALTAAS